MKSDPRRTYYDHEPAYRSRRKDGFRGWSVASDDGAYDRFDEFFARDDLAESGTVLDTGCGGGELGIRFAETGWWSVGFDFSETAVLLASENARNAGTAARFVRADCVGRWPFPDATFDLVLDNHVLHCLLDPDHRAAYLANVCRVLKPGGIVFSANMSAEGPLNYDRYHIDRETGTDANRTRIWVSQARVVDEFARAGLTVRNVTRHDPPNADESGDELVVEATRA
jgi:SAM-dependent methyltransferase